MNATTAKDPKYRHYKPKNLGVVRIDGRDHYLGKFNSDESWEKYHRLLAEWCRVAWFFQPIKRSLKPRS